MSSKRYTTTIVREGSMCFIPVPFDPKPVFGKVRAPVTVRLNGYSYRSTISAMGGQYLLPLRRSHREAAGLEGGETLEVTLDLDVNERRVDIPSGLAAALSPAGWIAWEASSYTAQREYAEAVEGAKKPETRIRRIAQIAAKLEAAS